MVCKGLCPLHPQQGPKGPCTPGGSQAELYRSSRATSADAMLAEHWLARGKDTGAAVRLLEKGPALPLVPTEGTENLLVRVME